MRNTGKKLLSIVAAATLLTSTVAMTGCNEGFHKQDGYSDYVSEATVASNGGFAVEKGDFVYFINGMEASTASNEYGEVTKGALMRIKKSDLKENKNTAQPVVKELFVASDKTAGIFIYGDYVYYATPTSDKNENNEVANDNLDFKCARLDGSEVMKGYYFRALSSSITNYRFVQADNGVVYCLYVESGTLKSYNTKDKTTTILVEGAGSYFFDQEDPTNANVYYTMSFTNKVDTDFSSAASYNQIYCVNAANTVSVNAGEASYTVKTYDKAQEKYVDYKTYDFDKDWMEDKNAEAKKTAQNNGTKYEAKYVFDDYTTYPYVNLGTLVVDGIGVDSNKEDKDKRYNELKEDGSLVGTSANTLKGYTYTITRHDNDGIYFTRTGDTTDPRLYYVAESVFETNNTVAANEKAVAVAWSTTNASSTALFLENGGQHQYIYVNSSSKIVRVDVDETTGKGEEIELCQAPSGAKLWKVDGDYLYYYAAGTNPVNAAPTTGFNVIRIQWNGAKDKYEPLLNLDEANEEYRPRVLAYVDIVDPSSWYLPEIITVEAGNQVLLYANAQAAVTNSYNYIYATSLATDTIEANNEAYEAAYELIENNLADENADLKKAAKYYFRTGTGNAADYALEDVKALNEEYKAKNNDKDLAWYEEFNKFVAAADSYAHVYEKDLITLIGAQTAADKEAIRQEWVDSLPFAEETEVAATGLEVWQICLIVAAGVIVVAAAIVIPVVIVNKKKAERARADAIVNAHKRVKLDTTDDKSIDVYADEEAEAPQTEESSEE